MEVETPPVEVDTPPVEVETPPVEVDTPPVEVVLELVIPPVVVVLVSPPVEVEVDPPVEVKPPVEVELEPPDDEVEPPDVEVEVEPPEVVVETTTLPLLPPLPPKNPPKKPPPKPNPPEPPITTGPPSPPPEGIGICGNCGRTGMAIAICCGSAAGAQLTVLVTTRRMRFILRGSAAAVRTILRLATRAGAALACLTYCTLAAGASATCTAPPPTTAPPAARADNFTSAIRTDISSALFAHRDETSLQPPLPARPCRSKSTEEG